jgi:hypothetical protein
MTDLKTITDGLRHHINKTCAGCPYSKFIKAPEGCLLGGLMPEALEALTEQDKHINELHRGIEDLREAMRGELKNG